MSDTSNDNDLRFILMLDIIDNITPSLLSDDITVDVLIINSTQYTISSVIYGIFM